ncbi:MAG: hypothetical protein AB1941_25585 [Gemmatimonadota bacterium]
MDLLLATILLLSARLLADGTSGRVVFGLALFLALADGLAEPRRVPDPLSVMYRTIPVWTAVFMLPLFLRLSQWYAVSVLAWLLCVLWLLWRSGQPLPRLLAVPVLLSAALLPLPHVTEFIGTYERPGYLFAFAAACALLMQVSLLHTVGVHLHSRFSPREQG